MKYYGRLAGNTEARSSLELSPAASTKSPYVAPSPGSKMWAYGENALSLVLNRTATALSGNIDYIAGMLDSPALRDDKLLPEQTVGGKTFGFTNLTGVQIGQVEISLGSGSNHPATWVYHGLFASQLGDFIRVYRTHTEHLIDEGEVRAPTDVHNFGGGGSSLFIADAELGSPFHRVPSAMAPMRRVISNLPPYSGSDHAVVIDAWEHDGLRLAAETLREIYGRPGCYLEVFNDNAAVPSIGNDGLYQVAYVSRDEGGDKIVLTRGGLHKVTLASAAAFTAGNYVTWQSSPNHAAVSLIQERPNIAYVAFKIGNDIYLSTASAGEDFPVLGSSAGVNDDPLEYAGRWQAGQVGLTDHEVGSGQNFSLVEGTRLYDRTGVESIVNRVEHAGEPIAFNAKAAPGSVYLVSPPGFALSPALQFPAGLLMGGSYEVDCRTLTTVREQLQTHGNSMAAGQSENPSDRLGMSRTERLALLNWMKYAKVGRTLDVDSPEGGVNPFFGPPARVLGEQRWKLDLVNETDADLASAHVAAADVLLLQHPTEPGPSSTRAVVVGVTANTLILRNVSKAGLLANEWDESASRSVAPIIAGGGGAGSTFVKGGKTFRVTAITYAPNLRSTDDGLFVPGIGLGAAYYNAFDADPSARFKGAGRFIEMDAQRPVTLLMPAGAGVKHALEVRETGGEADLVRLLARTGGATLSILGWRDGALHGGDPFVSMFVSDVNEVLQFATLGRVLKGVITYDTDSLRFSDVNIGTAAGTSIALSTAKYNDLPSQNETAEASILTAIHGATPGVDKTVMGLAQGERVFGDGLIGPANPVTHESRPLIRSDVDLSGGVVTASGPDLQFSVSINDVVAIAVGNGQYHYGTITGVLGTVGTIVPAWGGAPVVGQDMLLVEHPFEIKVVQCLMTAMGASHRTIEYSNSEANALTIPASSTRYIQWDYFTNAVIATNTFNLVPGNVLLARVVSDAVAVVSVEPAAPPIRRLDRRIPITVGSFAIGALPPGAGSTETYQNSIPTFPTLGEAFRMIEILEEDSNLFPEYQSYGWHVQVVGPTLEAGDGDKGIVMPLKVPTDGMLIEGVVGNLGSLVEGPAELSWDSDTALIDLNGKRGITFRGLRARWTGTITGGVGSGAPEVVLVSNIEADGTVSSGNFGPLRMENCHLLGGDAFVRLLNGIGEHIKILDCSARDVHTAGIIIDAIALADVEIRNFTWRGPSSPSAPKDGSRYGIRITDADHVLIHGVDIENPAEAAPGDPDAVGISVDGARRVVSIRDVSIENQFATGIEVTTPDVSCAISVDTARIVFNGSPEAASDGVVISGPDGPTVSVRNVFVSGPAGIGIDLGIPYSVVEACRVDKPGSSGVELGALGCTADTCTVIDAGAIGVRSVAGNSTIRNCTVLGAVSVGIYAEATEPSVIGNTVRVGSGMPTGILVGAGVQRAIVRDNLVDSPTLAGVHVLGAAAHAEITNNTVLTPGEEGIKCDGNDAHIADNLIFGSTIQAIAATGARTLITNNTATLPTGGGILCEGERSILSENIIDSPFADGIICRGANSVITGNSVKITTGDDCIRLETGAGMRVTNNDLDGRSTKYGIYAVDSGSHVISENRILTTLTAVRLGALAVKCQVRGNHIDVTEDDGILAEAANVTITGNSLYGVGAAALLTQYGIHVLAEDAIVDANQIELDDASAAIFMDAGLGDHLTLGQTDENGAGGVQGCVVSNNTILNPSTISVQFNDCVVEGNKLSGGRLHVNGRRALVSGNHTQGGRIDIHGEYSRVEACHTSISGAGSGGAITVDATSIHSVISGCTTHGGVVSLLAARTSAIDNDTGRSVVGVGNIVCDQVGCRIIGNRTRGGNIQLSLAANSCTVQDNDLTIDRTVVGSGGQILLNGVDETSVVGNHVNAAFAIQVVAPFTDGQSIMNNHTYGGDIILTGGHHTVQSNNLRKQNVLGTYGEIDLSGVNTGGNIIVFNITDSIINLDVTDIRSQNHPVQTDPAVVAFPGGEIGV